MCLHTTHTHTQLFAKIQKEKCDMKWYDMIWYDMIWYDMIWYDIALIVRRVGNFSCISSIYVYNQSTSLNNNIHFIHTRTQHIIHANITICLTLLLHLYNFTMFTILLIFFLFIIQDLKFIIQDCLMHKRVFQHNFVKYWDSVPPVWL